MDNNSLRAKVISSLDVAIYENGYTELLTQEPEQVAIDLCTFACELENDDTHEVEKHVVEYQKTHT